MEDLFKMLLRGLGRVVTLVLLHGQGHLLHNWDLVLMGQDREL